MKRMVRRAYLPALNDYAAEVAGNITAIKAACASADVSPQNALLQKLLAGIKEIDTQLNRLDEAHHAAIEIEDQQERANEYAHNVISVMDALRAAVDAMEIITDRDHWPVPTYNDMLFYV